MVNGPRRQRLCGQIGLTPCSCLCSFFMSLVFTAILNHDKLRFAVSHPQAQEKYDVSGSPVYNFDGKGVPSATSPLLHTSPLISSPTVVASTAASEFAEVPVVAGLPGPGIPERQMVFVSHLLKSAGTSAHHLVAKFMCSPKVYARQGFFYTECSPDAVKELNRQQTLYGNSLPLKNLKKAREKFFTIGMARNPCAYLVSMWAFVSKMRKTGPRAAHSSWQIPCLEKRLGKNATESLWQSESAGPTENVDRFRKWVRQSAGRTMHIHTFRSWLALHADEEVKKFPLWDDGQYYACMADVDAARENRIVDALKEVNLNDRCAQ